MNNESASHERDASEQILTTTREVTADCSGSNTTRERCMSWIRSAKNARAIDRIDRRLRRIESRVEQLESALEAHLAKCSEVK
jgi:uncharacterized protein (DUF2252 family)